MKEMQWCNFWKSSPVALTPSSSFPTHLLNWEAELSTLSTPVLPPSFHYSPNLSQMEWPEIALSLSLSASVVASLWLLLKAEPVSERSKKILKLIFHLFPRHAPRAGPGRVKIVARRAAPLAAWVCISKYHVGARISVFYPLTLSFFNMFILRFE